MNDYKPTKDDIQWAQQALGIINNHGIIVSSDGTYSVNHEKQTLRAQIMPRSIHTHHKWIATFAVLGYKVLPARDAT